MACMARLGNDQGGDGELGGCFGHGLCDGKVLRASLCSGEKRGRGGEFLGVGRVQRVEKKGQGSALPWSSSTLEWRRRRSSAWQQRDGSGVPALLAGEEKGGE